MHLKPLQLPVRVSVMDDLKITAKSVSEGRGILGDLEELTKVARMELKPSKSRSLVPKFAHFQDCL